MAVGRSVGNAVKRNRVRRVIREACRLIKNSMKRRLQIVWLVRGSVDLVSTATLVKGLQRLLGREGYL